jgi:hypothetical protein
MVDCSIDLPPDQAPGSRSGRWLFNSSVLQRLTDQADTIERVLAMANFTACFGICNGSTSPRPRLAHGLEKCCRLMRKPLRPDFASVPNMASRLV